MITIDRVWPAALAVAALLGGCATAASHDASAAPTAGEGLIRLGWEAPRKAEVTYDGKRYVGAWSGEPCSMALCGEAYRKTSRLHQRHLIKGAAVLVAEDGSRLRCDWVSHLPKVDGSCRADDGSSLRLRGGAGAA